MQKLTGTILVLLLMLMSTVTLAQDSAGPIELVDECFIEIPEGYDYECGYLTVPEYHGVDNGRTLQIAFVRYLSRSDSPDTPLFKTHGGPGGNELSNSSVYVQQLDAVLDTRDIVEFNQRGSRFSGDLECEYPEVGAAWFEQNTPLDELRRQINEAIQGCYDDFLEAGVDFNAYNSLENAADIDTLRSALGYDQIIYFGVSYGTMLGQHYLREYPDHVEALIWDGSVSLDQDYNWIQSNAVKYQFGIEEVYAACAAIPECEASYPDLPQLYDTAMERLRENPVTVVTDERTVVYNDLLLALTFNNMLESPVTRQQIPLFLYYLGTETPPDAVQVLGFMTGYVDALSVLPSGISMAHLAITCSEDVVESTLPLLTEGIAPYGQVIAGIFDAENYTFGCSLLDVNPLPDEARVPVPSDKPVLFLDGTFDNATPLYWNDYLQTFYPNSFAYELQEWHVVSSKERTSVCASDIITQFVNDPTTAPDGSCIADIVPQQFDPLPG